MRRGSPQHGARTLALASLTEPVAAAHRRPAATCSVARQQQALAAATHRRPAGACPAARQRHRACGCSAPTARRYLFNAGEGFQRYANEYGIKLNKLSGVLLTRMSTDAAGGLPGRL